MSAEKAALGNDSQYRRTLGIGAITLMVVAMASPLSVVAGGIPLAIGMADNTGTPVYFLAAGIILTVFSVGFTTMGKFVPNAGAFYSYIQAGLGKVPGMGSAIMAVVSYAFLLLSVIAYCGAGASNVVATFTGVEIPWWLFAVAAWAVIAVLGYRNVDLSSKVLGVFLALETISILVLDGAIVAQGGAEGLSAHSFAPTEFMAGAPGIGFMFAFFGFIGFEATAVFRNEAKDPDRTIPRATYLSVAIISVLYFVSAWCVVQGGGSSVIAMAVDSPDMIVANMAATYVGTVLSDMVQVLLVTSLFACGLASHNVIARYLYNLANVDAMPKQLAVVHPKHSAPSFASLIVTIGSLAVLFGCIAAGLDPVTQVYAWFSGGATLGVLSLEMLTSISVIVFFFRNRAAAVGLGVWKTVIAPGIASAGMIVVTGLVVMNFPALIGDVTSAVAMGVIVPISFAIGCVMAVEMKRHHPKEYVALGRLVDAAKVAAPAPAAAATPTA